MNKILIITLEVEISDVEHLNMDEVTLAASQQGKATIVDMRTEERKSY